MGRGAGARPTLVLRGGTVVDGTGAPPFAADVAVTGRTISAVGPSLAVRGLREVDARGLLVTPGWIDAHTHYDGQVCWDPHLSPSAANGVTTLVMGNCGVGLAPCAPALRGWLTDLLDSIEDIPAPSLHEGVAWEWETFAEYLASLEKRRLACDVGVLVGHAPVRGWVRGQRASLSDRPGGPSDNPLTAEEIERVAKVVEEAVAAGALGFSGSRQLAHRDKDGVLMPGSLASTAEMLAIGRGVARGGGGLYQMANDFASYDDVPPERRDPQLLRQHHSAEWRWITRLAKEHPEVVVSTGMGTGMTPDSAHHHRYMLRRYERIAEQGGRIVGQVMMRLGGLHFGVAAGNHPFAAAPTFKRLRAEAGGDGAAALVRLMALPRNRAAIVAESRAAAKAAPQDPELGTLFFLMGSAEWVWPWSADYEQRPEDSLAARARREGKGRLECAYDILTDPGAAHGGVLWRALYNYGTKDFEPLREMISHPQVVSGFADGGAHLKIVCDATTPTTNLTHWARDRTRGPRLALEAVVRKQTKDTAELLGLRDRGEIRAGMKADINVIDFAALRVLPPRFARDLPLRAGRWTQDAEGYRLTVVSGEVTYDGGRATGALPGRLVRNPRGTGRGGGLRGSVPAAAAAGPAGGPEVDLRDHARRLAKGSDHAGPSAVGRVIGQKGQKPAASRL